LLGPPRPETEPPQSWVGQRSRSPPSTAFVISPHEEGNAVGALQISAITSAGTGKAWDDGGCFTLPRPVQRQAGHMRPSHPGWAAPEDLVFDPPSDRTLPGSSGRSNAHPLRSSAAALLAEMLSLPNDGRYPALNLIPEQRRPRTLEALTGQLARLPICDHCLVHDWHRCKQPLD